jgi:hypothetical protein
VKDKVAYGRTEMDIQTRRGDSVAAVLQLAPQLRIGWLRVGTLFESEKDGRVLGIFVDMLAYKEPGQLYPYQHMIPPVKEFE